jgi:chromosome segregation ATPase
MIEAIMFFALGFLAASLVALVLLSAVWHRAVRLTTRRIEGAIPVSMAEIQADKDQLRAEFAMSTRRLEASVEQLKLKTTDQLAEIGRKTDVVRQLKTDVEETTAAVTSLEAQERALRDKLRATEEELSAKSRELHEAEGHLRAS